jgi:hypothetical protein
MAYSDQSQYPAGIHYSDLTGDVDVGTAINGTATDKIKVAWILASNDNAAAQVLVITDGSDNTVAVVLIPSDDSVVLPRGFEIAGLKMTMAVNTADVKVTTVYYDD